MLLNEKDSQADNSKIFAVSGQNTFITKLLEYSNTLFIISNEIRKNRKKDFIDESDVETAYQTLYTSRRSIFNIQQIFFGFGTALFSISCEKLLSNGQNQLLWLIAVVIGLILIFLSFKLFR